MNERRVAIVTDAAADLPSKKELKIRFGVEPILQIPLSITFGDDSYLTGEKLDNKRFKELINETGLIPKTAALGEGDFYDVYNELVNRGLDIISIHVDDKLSNTGNSARNAAKKFSPDRVMIYNSETVSMAQGLQVIMAEKAAARGDPKEKILEMLDSIKKRTTLRAIVPNIPYLKASGRVSHLKAILGTVLQIVPILQIDHGSVVDVAKLRTSRKILDWMVNYINEGEIPEQVAIVDFDAKEVADSLKIRLIKDTNVSEKRIYRGDLGPVTGSHSGPGTWAMITVREK